MGKMGTVDGSKAPAAIILAAGKGTRMGSALPKVLHPLGGLPLVVHVLRAAHAAGCQRAVLIVGYEADAVIAGVKGHIPPGMRVDFALQPEQLGTGHAVMMAEGALSDFTGDVFILPGDVPLVRGETLANLLTYHRAEGSEVTVLSSILPDAKHYGRIIRGDDGAFLSIVEARDCSPEALKVGEFNTGAFVVRAPNCFQLLKCVDTNNAQGEYYVTDLVSISIENGFEARAFAHPDHEEMLGINYPEELAAAEARLQSAS